MGSGTEGKLMSGRSDCAKGIPYLWFNFMVLYKCALSRIKSSYYHFGVYNLYLFLMLYHGDFHLESLPLVGYCAFQFANNHGKKEMEAESRNWHA